MQRSGKFYRKNEQEVIRALGLEPTPNSGSGDIVKEDGQSETVICQLKSTDANSIRVCKKDMDTLLYNASVTKKLPVFAIQFLQSNEVYVIVRPQDLPEAAEYLETGSYTSHNEFIGVDLNGALECTTEPRTNKIISSASARERFAIENENKFKKERRKAN